MCAKKNDDGLYDVVWPCGDRRQALRPGELSELLEDAWRMTAPTSLVNASRSDASSASATRPRARPLSH